MRVFLLSLGLVALALLAVAAGPRAQADPPAGCPALTPELGPDWIIHQTSFTIEPDSPSGLRHIGDQTGCGEVALTGTLPPANSVPRGWAAEFNLLNANGSTYTVAVSGNRGNTDTIYSATPDPPIRQIVMSAPDSTVVLYSDGVQTWHVRLLYGVTAFGP